MAKAATKKKAPPARSVESLKKLLAQINEMAPKRNKASDGWVGDAKHAARHSDHNAEPDGTVDARDFTHDPSNGADMRKINQELIASRDPRISYTIFEGKITSGRKGPSPWKPRVYKGSNRHDHHLHVSVLDEGQDDKTPWKISNQIAPPPLKLPEPPKAPPIKTMSKEEIEAMQERLTELGYPLGGVDGVVGPLTKEAILSFKKDNGLPANFEANAEFLAKLVTAEPRKMLPARAEATGNEVAAKVPEANAHWWNKWLGLGIGGTAGGSALIDAIAPARGVIDQVRDVATDVPGWAWLAGIAAIAFVIWYFANKGQKASTEAFRDGSRR